MLGHLLRIRADVAVAIGSRVAARLASKCVAFMEAITTLSLGSGTLLDRSIGVMWYVNCVALTQT